MVNCTVNIDFKKEEMVCKCGSIYSLEECYVSMCPCCSELIYHCNECHSLIIVPKKYQEDLLELIPIATDLGDI